MTDEPLANKLLDNYLSKDEESYFKTGGDETYEERLVADESNTETEQESSTDDSRGEPESSDGADEADSKSDGEREEASDELSESDDEDERGGNDEKSSKRDYEKAFKVERHKRKELKEAFEANARKTTEMEANLSKLQQDFARQQMQPVAPAQVEDIPDPDVDPLGYQQHQIKQLEKQITEHNKYLNQRHEYEQRNSQQQAFLNTYQQSAKQFADKTPDFTDAYKFLTQARMEEHKAAGYSVEEANNLLLEEEMAIVAKSYNDKVNPAERIYNLAKNRGYSAKSAAKNTPPAKNLKDLKNGMANSKSLKSGGGELPEKDLGIDDIDGMNFAEFDDFWSGYKAKSKGQG